MFPQRRRGNGYGNPFDFPITPSGGRWIAVTSDGPVYALGQKWELGTCDEREDLYHHAVREIFKRMAKPGGNPQQAERHLHNLAILDSKPKKGSR